MIGLEQPGASDSEEPFIVKVQVPLASNMPKDEQYALVYNEDRSVLLHLPLSPELLGGMRGHPKLFFWARITDEHFELGQEVPDPGW